jgi:hypothetical protein
MLRRAEASPAFNAASVAPPSWLAPAIVFGLALVVYLLTAPPGLTWAHDSADGGDLITAALTRGVPHPNGYPTWTVLAALFSHLPFGAAAWRATLLSMVSAAAAAALVAATTPWLAPAGSAWRRYRTAGEARPRAASPAVFLLPITPPLVAGLALAFSPLLWGQATVAEVYALHACLAAGALWSLVRRQAGGSDRWSAGAGVFLGLGLGTHLTTAWLLPAAGIILWSAGGDARGRKRAFIACAAGLAAGLLAYLYLPWAASGATPVQWADLRRVDGLWWLVSGQLYRGFVFATPGDAVPGRLAGWAAELWRSFLPWGLAAALLGLATMFHHNRALAVALLSSLGLSLIWAVGYNTSDSLLTLLPGWIILALAAGAGLTVLLDGLAGWRPVAAVAAAVLSIALVAAPLALYWPQQNLRNDQAAEQFYSQVLQHAAPDAVVLTVGDRATFALWYGRYGLGLRPDVTPVSRDLWALAGYREGVARNHPDLAGPAPPEAWPNLLEKAGRQRPIYVAQAVRAKESQPPDLPGWQAIPALQGDGWVLWRLEQ